MTIKGICLEGAKQYFSKIVDVVTAIKNFGGRVVRCIFCCEGTSKKTQEVGSNAFNRNNDPIQVPVAQSVNAPNRTQVPEARNAACQALPRGSSNGFNRTEVPKSCELIFNSEDRSQAYVKTKTNEWCWSKCEVTNREAALNPRHQWVNEEGRLFLPKEVFDVGGAVPHALVVGENGHTLTLVTPPGDDSHGYHVQARYGASTRCSIWIERANTVEMTGDVFRSIFATPAKQQYSLDEMTELLKGKNIS